MKSIAVTGGKGGTGKSTIAILMAYYYLSKGLKVILADCDVECPNDSIIIGRSLKNEKEKTYAIYPKIDKKKCNLCGKCIKSCKQNAIYKAGGVIKIEEMLCSSCGVCFHVCPRGAISKKKDINGKIFEDDITKEFKLVTGRSEIKVRETSPIVNEVRKYVAEYGNDYDICIIDTAAGTHCTVIQALEDMDEVFIVTEPTPLGVHDLKLMLELTKVLGLKRRIVINKSNLGKTGNIYNLAKKYKSDVYLEVPYDKKIEEIYMKGEFEKNPDLFKLLDIKNE